MSLSLRMLQMRRSLLISCVLLLASVVAAAQKVTVSGVVSTPDTSSIEWGVCYVSAGDSREGSYKFTVGTPFHYTFRASASYTLSFLLPGYETRTLDIDAAKDVDLGTVAMTADDRFLDASVVTADGTHLSFDRENITLNVADDTLLRHKSLKDVLTRLPLVQVSPKDNTIYVSSGSFAVTVNGKKNVALGGNNLNYVTDFLKGKDVQSVTINTAPVGRYGEYTAVIDIRVKEDIADFVAGSLSVSASEAYDVDGKVQLTAKAGKSVTEVTYSPAYTDAREKRESSVRQSLVDPAKVFSAYDTVKTDRSRTHALKLNSSYDLSRKDVLFFNADFKYGSSDGLKTSSFMDAFTSSLSDVETTDCAATLALQHDFKAPREKLLTFQAGFVDSRAANSWEIDGTPTANDTRSSEWSVGMDFSHSPVDRLNYYVTAGYRYRHYGSESGSATLLDYPQRMMFCKGELAYRMGKVRLSGSLMYDHTKDLSEYDNLNYNLVALYFVRPGQNLRFSAGRSIYRPDLGWLNTYQDNTVAGTAVSGNSSVRPEHNSSLLLGYNYMMGRKFRISSMVAYRWSDKGAFRALSVSDDGFLSSTYVNNDGLKSLRLACGLDWNPTDDISLTISPRCAWNRYMWGAGDIRNFEYGFYYHASATLWHDISFYMFGNYENPDNARFRDAQAVKMHNILDMHVGLSKDIGKCYVYVGVSDSWHANRKEVREIETSGYNVVSTIWRPVSRVSFGLTYSFGHFTGRAKRNMREFSASDNVKN